MLSAVLGILLIFIAILNIVDSPWVALFWGIIGVWLTAQGFKKGYVPNNNPKNKSTESVKGDLKVVVSAPALNYMSPEEIDTGPVSPSKDGGWTLNPQSTFPLTVFGIDLKTAKSLKSQLEKGYSEGFYESIQKVLPLVALHNVRCKEIEEYIDNHKPKFDKLVETQIKNSKEWGEGSKLDKEDMLAEFKGEAVDSIDVRPNCDLVSLFEGEKLDLTIDDELIKAYGFRPIQFYLLKTNKIYKIPSDHRDRKDFEKLAEVGLALRGSKIELSHLLEGLKLKEMKDFVKDLNPPKFSKKSKAIEYLLSVPDIKERMSEKISFRSMFHVLPLSPQFSGIDLKNISKAQKYARTVASLLVETYCRGGYGVRGFREIQGDDLEYIDGFVIEESSAERCCRYCHKLSKKTFPKNKYPKVPFHIGCVCYPSPIYS